MAKKNDAGLAPPEPGKPDDRIPGALADGDAAVLPGVEPTNGGMADAGIGPEVILDANLSIQNVAKLYGQIKKVYAMYDAIEIDASRVTSIDTASLQLFAALKKDAIKQNKTVDFFQPSPRFVESARLLGLLGLLEVIDV